ncbi:hypothetical protein GE21DRAFT_1354766 [Neurospora crassa]|nr:hypothetical protein GE21DRAFT_1354766 [Neurospora crassa]
MKLKMAVHLIHGDYPFSPLSVSSIRSRSTMVIIIIIIVLDHPRSPALETSAPRLIGKMIGRPMDGELNYHCSVRRDSAPDNEVTSQEEDGRKDSKIESLREEETEVEVKVQLHRDKREVKAGRLSQPIDLGQFSSLFPRRRLFSLPSSTCDKVEQHATASTVLCNFPSIGSRRSRDATADRTSGMKRITTAMRRHGESSNSCGRLRLVAGPLEATPSRLRPGHGPPRTPWLRFGAAMEL